MKVFNTKREEYRDCPIIIRHFGTYFEFLTYIDGEFYAAHFKVKPRLIPYVKYLLNINEKPYNEEEIENTRQITIQSAQDVIDAILDNTVEQDS